jgi:sRNA-binding regulator protein Hfq
MRHELVRASFLTAMMLGGVIATGGSLAAQDLSRLPTDHPEVTVVGAAGDKTTGTLRRFDATTVTLDLDGKDVVFQKQAIARIYDEDPLKNGMLIGLASGLGLAAVAAATADCGGGWFSEDFESQQCRGDERFFIFSVTGAVFGGAGLGVGAAIDAIVHRHRLLYQEPSAAGAASFGPVTLRMSRGGVRVSVGFAW